MKEGSHNYTLYRYPIGYICWWVWSQLFTAKICCDNLIRTATDCWNSNSLLANWKTQFGEGAASVASRLLSFHNHKDWKLSERTTKNKNRKFNSIPLFSVTRLQFQIHFGSAFEFFESSSVPFRIQFHTVPFDSYFRVFGSFRFRVKNWNRIEKKRFWCIPTLYFRDWASEARWPSVTCFITIPKSYLPKQTSTEENYVFTPWKAHILTR